MEACVIKYGNSARLSYPPRDSARVITYWECTKGCGILEMGW